MSALTLAVVIAASILLLRGMFGRTNVGILVFVGVLVTATVSLIGQIMRRQSNRRLIEEGNEERSRLKLDAAMRAGALLTSSQDLPISPASAASGLIALTKLDHSELAVALLVDLSSGNNRTISTETAVLVIDAALRSNAQPTAQLVAAELLCRNATQLDSCQSLHWPSAIDGCWDTDFGPKTKLLLIDGLIQMTLHGKHNENALRSVAVRLYGIWHGDTDQRVQGCVATLIRALIPALTNLGYTDFLQGNQKVMLKDLEAAAATATANPDGFLDRLVEHRANALTRWAGSCNSVDFEPGSLATGVHGPDSMKPPSRARA